MVMEILQSKKHNWKNYLIDSINSKCVGILETDKDLNFCQIEIFEGGFILRLEDINKIMEIIKNKTK